MAKSAFRRQTPEVGAVCINVHVRIWAGGAGKLVSLPRPTETLTQCRQAVAGAYAQPAFVFWEIIEDGQDAIAHRTRRTLDIVISAFLSGA